MITNVIQFLHTTAAYQAAVANLLIGQANLTAKQLNLADWKPIEGTNGVIIEVVPPPLGVSGAVVTSNYLFKIDRGHPVWVTRRLDSDAWKKETEAADRTRIPSLVDTNGARTLATQWLASLSVDVATLEAKYAFHAWQKQPRDPTFSEGKTRSLSLPIFRLGWGGAGGRYPSSFDPVVVELRGDKKQVVSLRINDPQLFTTPPLLLTNSAPLLGELPPPCHYVEELVGGNEAYATINDPEKVEVWLLTSFADDQSNANKPRTKAIRLDSVHAKRFSKPLLDFNSYAWTVMKLCSPDYGAKLRFTKGKSVVEFLLCYDCDILEVTFNGKSKSENFDYGHNQLVRPLQAAFPKDAAVKKLEFNDNRPEDLLKMFQQQ